MTPFQTWTANRTVQTLGTNNGALDLPFQSWKRFKEAFAPELILRAVEETSGPIKTCLDPFGGSGTTGIACQFMGIKPILFEINPYLADLIRAKLSSYKSKLLSDTLETLLSRRSKISAARVREHFEHAPYTFLPNSRSGNYIFSMPVAKELVSLNDSIATLTPHSQIFFRTILGSICIDVSNVTISGKGRRYRRNWRDREAHTSAVLGLFEHAARSAIRDIELYGHLKHDCFTLYNSTCTTSMSDIPEIDLCVFSPPYPNSFDYTDVYNVELWALGYLKSKPHSDRLRRSTFPSHVQLKRAYLPAPRQSSTLNQTLQLLDLKRGELWHPDIPEMVGSYFAEMERLLNAIASRLRANGRVYLIVGNSQYSGVKIETATIIRDLCKKTTLKVVYTEECRSMRTSPQQGGRHDLTENLIVLSK